MDYPISEAAIVGLSGDKFTDGDPGSGAPASVIRAKDKNALYDEVINAIKAASLLPDENDLTQLAAAIQTIAAGAGVGYALYQKITGLAISSAVQQQSAAHTLGVAPRQVVAWLECIIDDSATGYLVGDRLFLGVNSWAGIRPGGAQENYGNMGGLLVAGNAANLNVAPAPSFGSSRIFFLVPTTAKTGRGQYVATIDDGTGDFNNNLHRWAVTLEIWA